MKLTLVDFFGSEARYDVEVEPGDKDKRLRLTISIEGEGQERHPVLRLEELGLGQTVGEWVRGAEPSWSNRVGQASPTARRDSHGARASGIRSVERRSREGKPQPPVDNRSGSQDGGRSYFHDR